MIVKSIYINLPVRDLPKSRSFWTALGFTFNDQFSDEKALCLVLNNRHMYSMLISYDHFSTFTNRPISDGTTSQVLLAIEIESREQVDELVRLALENGGSRYKDGTDHGWMYYDCFADPDGHQWEMMFMDANYVPA